MERHVYHVTPSGNGDWKVKREGAARAASIHQDKVDAVERARELARAASRGQVVIHKQNGIIQTEHTYRKDPFPPRG